MLTQYIIQWFPSTVQSFWHSLPVIAFYLTELIAWIFFTGLISMIATIVLRSYTHAVVRTVNRRIQGIDWNSLSIEDRLERLRDLTKAIPVLRWAVDRIRLSDNDSSRQQMENVVDLCLMRYRENGFFSLFTRLSILIGLMGTLIGLTISVKDIFNFIDVEKINTVEQLRSSLQATLNGLGTAFVATLAGVFSATFLSPFMVWSRSCTLRLVQAVDSTLTLTILPLVAAEDRDWTRQVRSMVEQVSRQVVGDVVGEVVRNTVASLNELSLRLVEAVNATGTRQADIFGVVMKLDEAAQRFNDGASRSHEVLGQLNERLVALSQVVSKFTPDHESRLDMVKTVGHVLEEELSEHWANVRRQNSEQLLQIQRIHETVERLETALDRAAATICNELTPIQSQGSSILPKMNQAMQEIYRHLGELNAWLRTQTEQASEHLAEIHKSLRELSKVQEHQTERWLQQSYTHQASLEQLLRRIEEQIKWGVWDDKLLLIPTTSRTDSPDSAATIETNERLSDDPQPISGDASTQHSQAVLQLLGRQFQQSLRSWKQIDSEMRQTTQALNQLIEILQPDNRFLSRWFRKLWPKSRDHS